MQEQPPLKFVGGILVAPMRDPVTHKYVTMTVVVDQVGRLLQFPGGGPEGEETLSKTISREVLEETGIYVESWKYIQLPSEYRYPEDQYLMAFVPHTLLKDCIGFRGKDGELPQIWNIDELRASAKLDERHYRGFDRIEKYVKEVLS